MFVLYDVKSLEKIITQIKTHINYEVVYTRERLFIINFFNILESF